MFKNSDYGFSKKKKKNIRVNQRTWRERGERADAYFFRSKRTNLQVKSTSPIWTQGCTSDKRVRGTVMQARKQANKPTAAAATNQASQSLQCPRLHMCAGHEVALLVVRCVRA